MRRVRTITLDLIARDTGETSSEEDLQNFKKLDTILCWIASTYRGVDETVPSTNSSRAALLSFQSAWEAHPWQSIRRTIRF